MSKKSKIKGLWWIFGRDKDPLFGTLVLSGKGIHLEITNPVVRTRAEALMASVKEPRIVSTIFGNYEDDGVVTLIDCHCDSYRLGGNRDEYGIVAAVCVRGQHVESLETGTAKYISLSPRRFHRWLGDRVVPAHSLSNDQITWTSPRSEKLDYPFADGVTLSVSRMLLPARSLDKFEFRAHCDVSLSFDHPVTLETIMRKWVPSVLTFFSLLYGQSFTYESIGYAVENPFLPSPESTARVKPWPQQGRITTNSSLNESKEDDNRVLLWMPVRFEDVEQHLPAMVAKWSQVEERLRPAIDLFWAVVFQGNLYTNAAFLFLIQALEVYHVRSHFQSTQRPSEEHRKMVEVAANAVPDELKEWVRRKTQSSNYKPLDERLLEIFREHATEASQLFDDLPATVDRIAYTRNHLTHYNNSENSPRMISERDLLRITEGLERLLWKIFLKEVGLPNHLVAKAWKSLTDLRGLRAD